MVLNYQRWTPPCGCSFEQEVDSETGEVKLLFAHGICGGHEDIAKNTPEPKSLVNPKSDIIKKKGEAWERNKQKNISDYDNTEEGKRISKRLNVGLKNLQPDPDTLLLQDHYLEQQGIVENNVDKWTREKKIEMLLGLECPYSLKAHKVYDQILKEKQTVEG